MIYSSTIHTLEMLVTDLKFHLSEGDEKCKDAKAHILQLEEVIRDLEA